MPEPRRSLLPIFNAVNAAPPVSPFHQRLDEIRASLLPLDASAVVRRFGLEGSARLLKTTISLCPDCLATVPALVYVREGQVLMRKRCGAHGDSEALLESEFTAVKLRLGRSRFEHDLATVRAVRQRLPDLVHLMVDFNQALTFSDAMQHTMALDDEGVYWIEEPIRHDDYRHMALIGRAARTPIQIGENFTGLPPMAASLEGQTKRLMKCWLRW